MVFVHRFVFVLNAKRHIKRCKPLLLHLAGTDVPVEYCQVLDQDAGQRIDNFLMKRFRDVPKSLIYRKIRKGEVRVDKKRVSVSYKVQEGQWVRIPPIEAKERSAPTLFSVQLRQELQDAIVFEDVHLLVLNKPSGLSVHGGTNEAVGLIEALRVMRGEGAFLELAHRLDKHTSGLILLAKSRSMLLELHEGLKSGRIRKTYLTLAHGVWGESYQRICLPLQSLRDNHGHRARVSEEGKYAETHFYLKKQYHDSVFLRAELKTGRMHQIRAHLAHIGSPVLGDDKYGDFSINRLYRSEYGLKRLFLHAQSLSFRSHLAERDYDFQSALPHSLSTVLEQLDQLQALS